MSHARIDREPCPWRIVDDAGGAFAFGLIGGGIWNTFGGFRNAPRGQGFRQAIARVKARAPITGLDYISNKLKFLLIIKLFQFF